MVSSTFTILLYDFTHKFFTESPWIMGACRFWVYVIAGATGTGGLNGYPIFCGLALAFYVVGLSYVARGESFRGRVPLWPLLLLTAPIVLAWMMNVGVYRAAAMWVAAVLVLWLIRCVNGVFIGGGQNAGWIVTNLLAGITFVDWVAVAPQITPWVSAVVFLGLFGLTKWFQKFIPAT